MNFPVFTEKKDFFGWLSEKRISFNQESESVHKIISDVIANKDKAVKEYTQKFDHASIEQFRVSPLEEKEALAQVDRHILVALEKAKDNIHDYHLSQKVTNQNSISKGKFLGWISHPIEKVGLYVPGGLGVYPSTVLMTAVPAKIAGVPEVYMITPPNREGKIHPVLIAAAKLCGVDGIFKVGGVQGIASLAYGTEQIPKVYKIVGPGNMYVTLAKKYVYGQVDIDSLAGPSEVMIVVDEETPLPFIVADVFAQAEHSEDAQSIVLVPSEEMAHKVHKQVFKSIDQSPRKHILEKSVKLNSCILVYKNFEDAYSLINEYAPEHLEILSEKISYYDIVENVKNAGAIFVGKYTPVAMGDYFAGPNHTLPTNGTAKYASPLGVYDFMKTTSIVRYEQEELIRDKEFIVPLAELEGFFEHANSLKVRV